MAGHGFSTSPSVLPCIMLFKASSSADSLTPFPSMPQRFLKDTQKERHCMGPSWVYKSENIDRYWLKNDCWYFHKNWYEQEHDCLLPEYHPCIEKTLLQPSLLVTGKRLARLFQATSSPRPWFWGDQGHLYAANYPVKFLPPPLEQQHNYAAPSCQYTGHTPIWCLCCVPLGRFRVWFFNASLLTPVLTTIVRTAKTRWRFRVIQSSSLHFWLDPAKQADNYFKHFTVTLLMVFKLKKKGRSLRKPNISLIIHTTRKNLCFCAYWWKIRLGGHRDWYSPGECGVWQIGSITLKKWTITPFR